MNQLLAAVLGGLVCGVVIYLRMRLKFVEQLNQLQIENISLKEKLNLHNESQQQVLEKIENVTQKLIDEKTSRFSEQNLKSLSMLLDPFKEKLKDFEKRVEETYTSERTERGVLKGELSRLMELNQKMSAEAQQLTRALSGDIKTQGNWGELILETILEKSGLRKDEEYVLQGEGLSIKDDQGAHQKPDVIINLPDNKHIIVDSKASMSAYHLYVASDDENEKTILGRQHIDAIKKHIDGLGQKKYHSTDKLLSPDFVVLFMPLEPAFALAFRLKPDLLQYAWEKNIAIVSPTTLLTTLRTVASLWKQERQSKNAVEIAKRGGALYDKFYALVKDIENLGDKLGAAQKAQQDMLSKLRDGNGNLIRQVEMLKELGAKTEKKLVEPEQLT